MDDEQSARLRQMVFRALSEGIITSEKAKDLCPGCRALIEPPELPGHSPMIKDDVIESSRKILGGTPVFKGTRVPVKTLIDYLEAGDRLDDFLEDFPTVTREQALQALELAKGLLLSV